MTQATTVGAPDVADAARDAFHEGERAVQARAGVRERMAQLGPRVFRDYMPEQHRQFFAQLPFLVVGSVDEQRQPWATVLAGPPGFVASPTERRLTIRAAPLAGSPLRPPVAGMPVGLLGIEPHTRRRNRMNGHVDKVDAAGFEVVVDQSFGNCPRYIQARKPEYLAERAGRSVTPIHRAAGLDEAARELIGRSDTFFIASAHPTSGVDVSHRGGRPGFVRVLADSALVAPDFAGNSFFNTLGNLCVDPRAGLLFLDFDSGDCLYLAATATIVWEGAQVAAFPGAQRLLRFEIRQSVRAEAGLPLRWGLAESSPSLPQAC